MTPHCREKTMGPATVCGGRAHQLTQKYQVSAPDLHAPARKAHMRAPARRVQETLRRRSHHGALMCGTQSLFSAAASARSTDA